MVSVDSDVSNGVVHTLRGVLLPSWVYNTITDIVVATSNLSTLLSLLVLSRVDVDLKGAGAITLFAPTNAAFNAMQQSDLQALTNPDNLISLLTFLAKHVVQGVFTTFMLAADQELPNILGTGVTVTSINPILLDGVASIVDSDALANNGVVHAIDTVLDPLA
jgi:transforming growth factor-beta-induced protein